MTTRNGKKGTTAAKTAKTAKNATRKAASPRSRAQAGQNEPREPTDIGMNRTGAGTAPMRSARTAAEAARGPRPDPEAFRRGHAEILRSYETNREPVGTMPPPTRLKGAVKMLADLVSGKKGTVLLDKLGERLAFERGGTRLYDMLLAKHAVQGGFEGGPSRADLLAIRDDEHDHYLLLTEVLVELGADPTVITPCADVAVVSSIGLQKVVGDPRTTLGQALQAIHVAELTDNDGWDMLIDLVDGFGHQDLADRFRACQAKEAEHLERVRNWLYACNAVESGALLAS